MGKGGSEGEWVRVGGEAVKVGEGWGRGGGKGGEGVVTGESVVG